MNNIVVIVEDDPFMKELYRIILKRSEIKSIITEDGDALINILKNESVGLLIMDINLKNTYLDNNKVDGVSLSRFIKSNESFAHIPIIIVSAYSGYAEMERIKRETSAFEYVTKPIINFEKFAKLIIDTLTLDGRKQSINC